MIAPDLEASCDANLDSQDIEGECLATDSPDMDKSFENFMRKLTKAGAVIGNV